MSRGMMEMSDVQLFSVFEALDEGVIVADKDGRIVFYNHAQAQLDDLDPEYVTGKKVTEIYNLDDDNSMIMRCLRSGRAIKGEIFFYRTCRGKLTNTIHSVYPLTKDGVVTGAICFVKDYNYLEQTIASASRANPHEPQSMGNGTRYRFTDIVSTSPQCLEAVKLARLSADTPSPVMLQGETGTGKEMFAQSIHNYSARRHRPFIGINCAAIPKTSSKGCCSGPRGEHSRGRWRRTGPLRAGAPEHPAPRRSGFHASEPPGKTPSRTPGKADPAGGRKRGNPGRPENHQFRRFRSPPKPSRKGSSASTFITGWPSSIFESPRCGNPRAGIEALTRHFIYKNNLMMGKSIDGVGPGVMELFLNHPWPGNVRELEHVIEGAMNVCERDGRIEVEHLPGQFPRSASIVTPPEIPVPPPAREFTGGGYFVSGIRETAAPEATPRRAASAGRNVLKENREKEESDTIARAVSESGGNLAQAARRLGISRQLLYYKIKKYRLATRPV